MRTQTTYTARRHEASFSSMSSWGRNRNTVRHQRRELGTTSFVMIVGLLVLIVGLIYTTQGTRATNYDYKLSEIEAQISELEGKKEDLAVERARLTSIAATEKSKVAVAMEDGRAKERAE